MDEWITACCVSGWLPCTGRPGAARRFWTAGRPETNSRWVRCWAASVRRRLSFLESYAAGELPLESSLLYYWTEAARPGNWAETPTPPRGVRAVSCGRLAARILLQISRICSHTKGDWGWIYYGWWCCSPHQTWLNRGALKTYVKRDIEKKKISAVTHQCRAVSVTGPRGGSSGSHAHFFTESVRKRASSDTRWSKKAPWEPRSAQGFCCFTLLPLFFLQPPEAPPPEVSAAGSGPTSGILTPPETWVPSSQRCSCHFAPVTLRWSFNERRWKS